MITVLTTQALGAIMGAAIQAIKHTAPTILILRTSARVTHGGVRGLFGRGRDKLVIPYPMAYSLLWKNPNRKPPT